MKDPDQNITTPVSGFRSATTSEHTPSQDDTARIWRSTGGDPVQASDNLRRIGRTAGLDKAQLDACLEDEDKARTLVTWFRANAEADDVSATPTLLINVEVPIALSRIPIVEPTPLKE